MNGLILFERTIEQTTETMPLALKQKQLLHHDGKQNKHKLTRAAALPLFARQLGFGTLCFCFPTKMLHFNVPFSPLKGVVPPPPPKKRN